MKTIKDLQQMIREPASKEWFEKHGSVSSKKHSVAKKMGTHETKMYKGNGERMSKGEVRRSRKADHKTKKDLKVWREHAN